VGGREEIPTLKKAAKGATKWNVRPQDGGDKAKNKFTRKKTAGQGGTEERDSCKRKKKPRRPRKKKKKRRCGSHGTGKLQKKGGQ